MKKVLNYSKTIEIPSYSFLLAFLCKIDFHSYLNKFTRRFTLLIAKNILELFSIYHLFNSFTMSFKKCI